MIHPTVVIPTYNAAEFLDDCLRSVAGIPRILIHDCGSTDDTIKIARSHGAYVKQFGGQHWDVFPEYTFRNRLILDAPRVFPETTHVIIMDADEVISHNLPAAIEEWPEDTGMVAPYYQLVGHPALMETQQPIEYRLLMAPAGYPLFEDSGAVGPHQAKAAWPRIDINHDVRWFHLGYTGDLGRRWQYNYERGDWPEATYFKVLRNPYPWQDVRVVPTILRNSCLTLHKRILSDHREVCMDYVLPSNHPDFHPLTTGMRIAAINTIR